MNSNIFVLGNHFNCLIDLVDTVKINIVNVNGDDFVEVNEVFVVDNFLELNFNSRDEVANKVFSNVVVKVVIIFGIFLVCVSAYSFNNINTSDV